MSYDTHKLAVPEDDDIDTDVAYEAALQRADDDANDWYDQLHDRDFDFEDSR